MIERHPLGDEVPPSFVWFEAEIGLARHALQRFALKECHFPIWSVRLAEGSFREKVAVAPEAASRHRFHFLHALKVLTLARADVNGVKAALERTVDAIAHLG
jgi:hypothetical protein